MLDPNADKVFVFETSSAPYEVEAGKKIKWCPCGRAEGGIICDGKHKINSNFKSVPVVFTENKTVRFCRCKMTNNPQGLCDGSHKKLDAQAKGTYKDLIPGCCAQKGHKPWINSQEAAKVAFVDSTPPPNNIVDQGNRNYKQFAVRQIFKNPIVVGSLIAATVTIGASVYFSRRK